MEDLLLAIIGVALALGVVFGLVYVLVDDTYYECVGNTQVVTDGWTSKTELEVNSPHCVNTTKWVK
jgi:hypothetical protein